jgi:hypothetical protein
MTPVILNIDTGWWLVVGCTLLQFYSEAVGGGEKYVFHIE